MADLTPLQGHDLIPRELFREDLITADIFEKYLPGHSVNGAYNFVAAADNPTASLQLDTLLHSGSHSWLNDSLSLQIHQSV